MSASSPRARQTRPDAGSSKARGARATAPSGHSDERPWSATCTFVITALWGAPFCSGHRLLQACALGARCVGQAGLEPEDLDLDFILRPFLTLKIFRPEGLGTEQFDPHAPRSSAHRGVAVSLFPPVSAGRGQAGGRLLLSARVLRKLWVPGASPSLWPWLTFWLVVPPRTARVPFPARDSCPRPSRPADRRLASPGTLRWHACFRSFCGSGTSSTTLNSEP